MHIVCRPLPMGDQVLKTGAEVDANGWRNLSKLINQRYLRALTAEEVFARQSASVSPKRGREESNANR